MMDSNFLVCIPSSAPILFGNERKNQMCATGTTNWMCPMRSRLTFFSVTSTPHRSQTMPL